MMASSVQNQEKIEIHVNGEQVKVFVPNDPIAILMYYFNTVCSCFELDSQLADSLSRLRDYQNYSQLTHEEEVQLIKYCLSYNPETMGIIFIFDKTINPSVIKFVDETTIKHKLRLVHSFPLGPSRQKQKILYLIYTSNDYKWMMDNYHKPIEELQRKRHPALPQMKCAII
uniref:Uncharacterized protein n=1 Tax=Amphimedon queenslandica TaxID=400682 RepID=A0A1X7UFC0_AMPQE